jgi:hypothetical protein
MVADDDVIEATDGIYDLDIGIDTIQANMACQSAPGPCLPPTQWNELSADSKSIWQTILAADKTIILGLGKGSPTTNTMTMETYVHNVAIEDEDPTVPDVDEMTDNRNALMAYSAKQKNPNQRALIYPLLISTRYCPLPRALAPHLPPSHTAVLQP